MQYRNSLRFRIFATFLGAGLLLGPLLALGFISIANELEEFAVERALAGRLSEVMAAAGEAPTTATPDSPEWRAFGDIDLADIPAELSGKTGIYTVESGKPPELAENLPRQQESDDHRALRSWFLAVGQKEGVNYVVASDQTMLELRESLSTWVIVAGTFLSVCASLWLGYFMASRLIRPLQQLAAATAGNDGGKIDPQDYPPDEIGQLATALKNRHDELTHALMRERAFSAEVAHELRNPLAVIQSTMEIIEHDSGLASGSSRALGRALDAAGEMNETLGALLLVGREQHALPTYAPLDVATLLQPVIEKNSAGISTQLQWRTIGAPSLRAPAMVIRMIADNLIKNAKQNTPSGQVDVSLYVDRLVVRDTGIGIPPAELALVRERGVRGSNAQGEGSGLGLALVDRLCRTFGWSLDIQSRIGEGTTATWWFDRATDR
jgi:signal transduction histidine kinase